MLEVLNFIVGSTSTLLSAYAIYLYIILWKKDKTDGSYDVFDAFYKDILFKGMDHPELRNREYTRDYKNKYLDNDRVRYEAYAFLTINFCETLYDRGNKDLLYTWQDVIFVELDLHNNWFKDNQNKYKKEFLDFLTKMTDGRSSR
jgi:hypothetical protein